jgi:hypothetical protein
MPLPLAALQLDEIMANGEGAAVQRGCQLAVEENQESDSSTAALSSVQLATLVSLMTWPAQLQDRFGRQVFSIAPWDLVSGVKDALRSGGIGCLSVRLEGSAAPHVLNSTSMPLYVSVGCMIASFFFFRRLCELRLISHTFLLVTFLGDCVFLIGSYGTTFSILHIPAHGLSPYVCHGPTERDRVPHFFSCVCIFLDLTLAITSGHHRMTWTWYSTLTKAPTCAGYVICWRQCWRPCFQNLSTSSRHKTDLVCWFKNN